MNDNKETHIKLKANKATGIASMSGGSNINGIAFNVDFIAEKDPALAVDLLDNYEKASALSPSDPEHPDEDAALALEKLKDITTGDQ